MSLAKQLSPAKEAELRLRVVRLVMLGKSKCLRCTFSRLATCSTLNFLSWSLLNLRSAAILSLSIQMVWLLAMFSLFPQDFMLTTFSI